MAKRCDLGSSLRLLGVVRAITVGEVPYISSVSSTKTRFEIGLYVSGLVVVLVFVSRLH